MKTSTRLQNIFYWSSRIALLFSGGIPVLAIAAATAALPLANAQGPNLMDNCENLAATDYCKQWWYQAMDLITATPAVAKNGMVYVAATHTLIAISSITTGNEIKHQAWDKSFGSDVFLRASPALSRDEKSIFVTVNNQRTRKGNIYAYSAIDGTLLWQTDVDWYEKRWSMWCLWCSDRYVTSSSSPKVDPSTGDLLVYVLRNSLYADEALPHASDSFQALYTLKRDDQVKPDGKWQLTQLADQKNVQYNEPTNFAQWEPAVDGQGRALSIDSMNDIIPGGSSPHMVKTYTAGPEYLTLLKPQLNRLTSTKLWSNYPHEDFSSLAVNPKHPWVYVGTKISQENDDGTKIADGYLISSSEDSSDPDHVWKLKLGNDLSAGGPAVADDGTVYVADAMNGFLYAIDATSKRLWSVNSDGGYGVHYRLAIDNIKKMLYFVSEDGQLYAVDVKDATQGKIIWHKAIHAAGTPVITATGVVVATSDKKIFGFIANAVEGIQP